MALATKNIKQQVIVDATPEKLFSAWLDSKQHGEMVEGSADIDPRVGGIFTIWDGAIVGKTLEIDKDKRKIVQQWRYDYDDWPVDQPSKLIIEFVPYAVGKTKISFRQTGLPEQYADEVANGWKDYYWEPMRRYFSNK